MARLAPAALSASQARSTAALLPDMTVCPGSLKLAASTTSGDAGPKEPVTSAQTATTLAASIPKTAAIAPAPTGTASCMAWARRRTRGAAWAIVSTPAATNAAYSPSEWPATACGAAPVCAIQARYAATPATSITGWVLVVRASASLGPSRINLPMSSANASDASCTVCTTAGWSAHASSIPTDWEP